MRSAVEAEGGEEGELLFSARLRNPIFRNPNRYLPVPLSLLASLNIHFSVEQRQMFFSKSRGRGRIWNKEEKSRERVRDPLSRRVPPSCKLLAGRQRALWNVGARGERGASVTLNRSDSHWKKGPTAHVRARKRHSSSRCAAFSPRVTANPTLAGWPPRWGRVSNFWSVSRSWLAGYAVWKVDDDGGGGAPVVVGGHVPCSFPLVAKTGYKLFGLRLSAACRF